MADLWATPESLKSFSKLRVSGCVVSGRISADNAGMDTVTIEAGFRGVRAALGEFERQADFAIALAITEAVQAGRDAWPGIIKSKVDNPVKFSERAAYSTRANKRRLRAEVGIKSAQLRYISPLFVGGVRALKTLESIAGVPAAVPADFQRRNKFGNVARKRYVQVFRQAKRGGGKFVLNPDGRSPGIYQRSRRGLKPLFFFVDKTDYKPVLSMARDIAPVVRKRLPIALERGLIRALSTANKKAAQSRR